VWAAWNAGFDRAIWNYATLGFPELLPHHIIDVMAQATASGLPADLNYAAKFSGSTHKMASGKSLIALFCVPGAAGTPQSHPDQWQAFLSYAGGDIIAMRDIFLRTRQLPLAEWQEYWAMEAINSRGIAIDLKMVEHAARLAEQDRSFLASPTTLARFAIAQVRVGRCIDVRLNSNEVLSRYAQERRGFRVERLHHSASDRAWREVLVEDPRATPAEVALTRVDFEDWLATLSPRQRTLANSLAEGHTVTELAAQFRLSVGRVSQLRRELAESWDTFHGGCGQERPAAALP
jgi:hypothetical protein